ncbi:thermonuclease family protein [Candidatus Uhrbacteria bacterium]|nr:thermonuclease family protein [Candidatus Uhrbacteria bacterium]
MSFMEPMLDAVRGPKRFRVSLAMLVTAAMFAFGAYVHGVDGIFRAAPARSSAASAVTPVAVAPDGTVLVAKVVDGDTIVLEGGETVRYIGIDTPETVDPRRGVQCFGPEASKANKALVEGKRVRLVSDVEDRDKYHRLLRYVYLPDGTFVNLELARQGFAPAYTYPPNNAHVEEFRMAAREAREAKRGLWAGCRGVRTDRGEDAYRKLQR